MHCSNQLNIYFVSERLSRLETFAVRFFCSASQLNYVRRANAATPLNQTFLYTHFSYAKSGGA